MRWIQEAWTRLRALFDRSRVERELDEELAFHLEREAEKLEARGMSPEEARREAHIRFGGVERFKERTREAWGIRWLEDLADDVRFALRQLRRNPAFSAVAGLTLALGIAGTAAIFSVVQGLLLRPLPYERADRVVVFWSQLNWRGQEYDHVRERTTAFEELAAYGLDGVSLRTGSSTSLAISSLVTANMFDALGAELLLGRTFREGEDRPGAEDVAVLSHRLWQSEFGGEPGIVGRRVTLNGIPTTVVGVMPPDFFFPVPEIGLWRPLDLDPADPGYANNGWLSLVGRLEDRIGDARIRAELDRITTALGERFSYPERWDKTRGAHLIPIRDVLLGDVEAPLVLLLGAVGALLLMACVNVASLMLARMSDRREEVAVRSALGAGRGRLARQLLTETAVLGLVAGAVGAAAAALSFDALLAVLPLQGPYGFGDGYARILSLDWSLAGGALALAVGTGVVVGLAPLRRLGGARPAEDLSRSRGSGGGGGGGRLQSAFVAAEVVLAVILVAGAALLARSVAELQAVDLGMEPDGVLAVDLFVGEGDMPAEERLHFFRETAREAAALPSVQQAALITRLPIRDRGWQGSVRIADRPELSGERAPNSYWRVVTPDYFQAMGIRVLRGRGFTAEDRLDAPDVAVVNQAFVDAMWPEGTDALGKRIRSLAAGGTSGEWATVVGVAEDTRVVGLRGPVPPVLYRPYDQLATTNLNTVLVLTSSGDPLTLAGPVRALVRRRSPAVAVARITSLVQVVESAMAESLR
ncbi:MAG: FtsX-like permease family protein, partial [Gemmatimonadetes bacterium]|nr:FtsX-like permease family protein [Gemmatimonadota bacterium]NIR77767.1 FtsX-like permease family protein [Gemmatimonadota bacterium]NIT86303.1 FtsX-like permease family protein [Gemmatimonadota bacterium]NIU30137.1 FtsX-like permease family protein [Gemmatimonadota bacterium]NIU35077.1 FtsX-like permease family protein [Gemmatimonadota bacterium]